MALDLDQDYTINGHTFKAGKNVDASVDEPDKNGKTKKVDYTDSLKEQIENAKGANEYANTHHGAVPDSDNPMEATAQTPTRPLGAPNLAGDAVTQVSSDVENVHEVKDPTGEGADESNKDAQQGDKK